ncbi:hypothetical protein ACPJHQ_10740 [Rossellomorea sp. H39__3]
MKIYIAFLVQLMLWSVFYIAEWFSTKDHVEYKWIMFALFFYLSFLVAGKIVQSRKLTLFITSSSLCCFFAFKVLFEGDPSTDLADCIQEGLEYFPDVTVYVKMFKVTLERCLII